MNHYQKIIKLPFLMIFLFILQIETRAADSEIKKPSESEVSNEVDSNSDIPETYTYYKISRKEIINSKIPKFRKIYRVLLILLIPILLITGLTILLPTTGFTILAIFAGFLVFIKVLGFITGFIFRKEIINDSSINL